MIRKSGRARIAVVFSAALCVAFLTGAGQPAPRRKIEFSAAQQAALDRISIYLNNIQTLKSGFVQLGPDGQLDQGEFYLEKPGKMRFAYDPPNPTLIVGVGGKVYVKNAKLNTIDSYDLSDTPLGLLLDDKVNLKTSDAITGVDVQNDAVVVRARTSNNRQQGNITLVFSSPVIELRQWTVKDNQGGDTVVALRGLVTGVPLEAGLFTVPVKAPTRTPAAATKPN